LENNVFTQALREWSVNITPQVWEHTESTLIHELKDLTRTTCNRDFATTL